MYGRVFESRFHLWNSRSFSHSFFLLVGPRKRKRESESDRERGQDSILGNVALIFRITSYFLLSLSLSYHFRYFDSTHQKIYAWLGRYKPFVVYFLIIHAHAHEPIQFIQFNEAAEKIAFSVFFVFFISPPSFHFLFLSLFVHLICICVFLCFQCPHCSLIQNSV